MMYKILQWWLGSARQGRDDTSFGQPSSDPEKMVKISYNDSHTHVCMHAHKHILFYITFNSIDVFLKVLGNNVRQKLSTVMKVVIKIIHEHTYMHIFAFCLILFDL